MATLGANVLTLADWAKRVDPKGNTANIIELLSQMNEVLDDMTFIEGNLPTGHRTTVRTGLPTAYFRLLNQGVQVSKGTTAQVDEQTGKLEAWSEVDVDLAKLNGNTGEFRLSEAQGFIEAMNQTMASTVFYGNTNTTPEQFMGFAPRFSSLSGGNSGNIIDCGGTGSDNTSIWLVGWHPNTVTGMFPKGSQAGLVHEDLGEQTIESANGVGGSRLRVFQDRWQWNCGLAVRDWRFVVRLANIDISNLVGQSSAADLVKSMIKAIHRLPSLKMVKPAFYMNRTCYEMLDIQRRDDVQTGGQLKYEQVDGIPMMSFRGIPIRRVDQLLSSEARVV